MPAAVSQSSIRIETETLMNRHWKFMRNVPTSPPADDHGLDHRGKRKKGPPHSIDKKCMGLLKKH